MEVGSEFYERNFFLAIVTLGGVELCMTQFPSLNFSIFNLYLAHLHGNFQYFPYFWPNWSPFFILFNFRWNKKTKNVKPVREGLKKWFLSLGGRGGQQGSIITFYYFIFFVPNVLKIISRHYSFFKFRGRGGHLVPWGAPQAPPLVLAKH